MRCSLLRLTLCLCFAASFLLGQNAEIAGRVQDPSGALVPRVDIVVVNVETGVVRNSASNEEGRFVIPMLQPGKYRLTAQKEGFRPLVREGISLQIGDRITLNLSLEMGSTSETVVVTGDVPLLRVEDAQAGLVIDNKRIQELPQYNRNALAFAQMAPNVSGSAEQGGHTQDFRINGGRTAQVEYLIDGIPVTTGYDHDVPPSVPPTDAISEFKVISNGMAAEYGRLSGGAVLIGSKSGTNELHGSVFEFFRNEKLNANTWNSNRYGQQKGAFHDNIFGGSLGGPVLLPRIYDGRGKTFFFVAGELTRNSTGNNAALTSVPTELERQGDFSQSLYNGKPAQVYDWATGQIVNGKLVRQLFPGSLVPKSRWDPLAEIYMGYYPQANRAPQAGTSADNNYIYSRTNVVKNGKWTGRLDQNWNSTQTTHVMISRFDDSRRTPRTLSPLQNATDNWRESTTASFEHVLTLSATTVLTARLGFVRMIGVSGSSQDPSIDGANWPMSQELRNLLGTTRGRLPEVATASYAVLGGGQITDNRDTDYTAGADLQKLYGKHTFKAGVEHRRYYFNQYTGGSAQMATTTQVTASSPENMSATGHPWASFLLGKPTWGQGTQYAGPASLQPYWGAYVQDDIKVTQKLSLNLGVRWDFEPSRTERFDRQTFWDPNYVWDVSPASGWSWNQVEQAAGRTLTQPVWMEKGVVGRLAMMNTPEYPGRTLIEDHPYRFSPRVAAAWQFMPRTVLRAGYGINRMTVTGSAFINGAVWNVGYGDMGRMMSDGTPDAGLTYPVSFSNPYPNGAGYIPYTRDVNALNKSVMGNWIASQTPQFSAGHEHVVQLGIQREFGGGPNSWVLEVSYSGNLGRELPLWAGIGEALLPDAYHKLGSLGDTLLKWAPNPFYGFIPASNRGGEQLRLGMLYQRNPLWQRVLSTGDPLGTSNYNAGYVQVEHRFGHGFSFLANYTLGKLMQDCGAIDNNFGHAMPQAGLGPGDVYSIAPVDIRHKVYVNYSWDIPFGAGRSLLNRPQNLGAQVLDRVIGGWTIAGNAIFRGGNPISVNGTDGLWNQAGHATSAQSERPVWVSRDYNPGVSGHASLDGSAGYTPYMNAVAFRKAQAFPDRLEIGDVGAVIPMRAPGFSQWDLSLLKNFGLGKEGRFFQLRMEAENLFNHMNAGAPSNAFTNPVNFGRISSQAGNPRRIMIAGKIHF